MQFLAFSRSQETEADYLGIQYMYKSGYDPSSFVTFFEKLQALEKGRRQVSKMFQTHPPGGDRIAAAKENIGKLLAQRDEYAVTTSEFVRIKETLIALEARNTQTTRDENRPGLKRKTSSPEARTDRTTDGETASPDPDDRPKLKRQN